MSVRPIEDSELRDLLKAEQKRFKELFARRDVILENLFSANMTEVVHIDDYDLVKAQLKDSAEEIAHLYKKLHPYFPVGTCPQCGSVTTKIVGSGFNHWGCIACGAEKIE